MQSGKSPWWVRTIAGALNSSRSQIINSFMLDRPFNAEKMKDLEME